MVFNPEFIIQGLPGLQLARHQQAFLSGGGETLPPSLRLKPAGGGLGIGVRRDKANDSLFYQ